MGFAASTTEILKYLYILCT